jgi:hypothetical protein
LAQPDPVPPGQADQDLDAAVERKNTSPQNSCT